MNKLIPDLEILIYSYLDLEELLIFLHFDDTKKSKTIKLYHRNLTDINSAIKNNEFQTLKYLIDNGIKVDKSNIHVALNVGNTKFLKYFIGQNISFDNLVFVRLILYGNLDLIKLALTKFEYNKDSIKFLVKTYKPQKDIKKYLKLISKKKSCCVIC